MGYGVGGRGMGKVVRSEGMYGVYSATTLAKGSSGGREREPVELGLRALGQLRVLDDRVERLLPEELRVDLSVQYFIRDLIFGFRRRVDQRCSCRRRSRRTVGTEVECAGSRARSSRGRERRGDGGSLPLVCPSIISLAFMPPKMGGADLLSTRAGEPGSSGAGRTGSCAPRRRGQVER